MSSKMPIPKMHLALARQAIETNRPWMLFTDGKMFDIDDGSQYCAVIVSEGRRANGPFLEQVCFPNGELANFVRLFWEVLQ